MNGLPTIKMIVAMDDFDGIGKNGRLPWPYNGPDMKHFRDTTMGHPVLMGRNTFESLRLPHGLPGRRNIVLSRELYDFGDRDLHISRSPEEALSLAAPDETLWVIGGAVVYDLMLDLTEEILVTRFQGDFDADTRFPRGWQAGFELAEQTQIDTRVRVDRWTRETG